MRAVSARDLPGLVPCPWHCGLGVRRTVNNNAKAIWIDPIPDDRGRIAAWDTGGGWRSRQLRRGESLAPHERRYVIHNATCRRRAAHDGRPVRPPRPVPAPPAPCPIPAGLVADLHAELDALRQRQREQRGRT